MFNPHTWGYEPKTNEGLLWKSKSRNILWRSLLFIWRAIGRLPLLLKPRWFKPYYSERIVEIPFLFKNLPSKPATILDFGCGESKISMQLASLGYEVHGVDLTPYPYKHPNFFFHQGNFLNLQFNKQFDVISCISSIEHAGLGAYERGKNVFARGDVSIIQKFYTLLKPEGLLILTIPYGKKYQETEFQRIYDGARLQKLISKFSTLTKALYARKGEIYVPVRDVKSIPTTGKDGEANAVACLVLQKK